jgi:hypothetical protein
MDSLAAQEVRALCMHPRLQPHLPRPSQATLDDVLAELLPFGRVTFRSVNGGYVADLPDSLVTVPAAHFVGCILRLRHGVAEGEEAVVVVNAAALADVVVGSGITSMSAALRCLLALTLKLECDVGDGVADIQSFLADF